LYTLQERIIFNTSKATQLNITPAEQLQRETCGSDEKQKLQNRDARTSFSCSMSSASVSVCVGRAAPGFEAEELVVAVLVVLDSDVCARTRQESKC
jgi:hypothetical protein